MKKILVIDGNSIINRAFFGVRPLTTKSGKNTNAIYGMMNIVKRHLDHIKPDYAVVAFDIKAPTFRHKMFDAYKAGRHATPPELLEQFADAKECLSYLGFHVLTLEGYEADDIQGTVAKFAEEYEAVCEEYIDEYVRQYLEYEEKTDADYTAEVKYRGFQDYRGGGHFSARLTAPLVAAGAIIESALMDKGIFIGTHIKNLHGIYDRDFTSLEDDIALLFGKLFPVLDGESETAMKEEILKAKEMSDSIGGILETAVIGLPAGVGEPWFDSLESTISHILFSVPGIKGVEFGLGFGFADKYGSEANDAFFTDGEKIYTKTNNNGGINGGISNGMPIIFRTAVRPTPSIFKEQDTVSLSKMENTVLKIEGRHDPAIIHRARAVVDAVTAIAIADALTSCFGTSYFGG